MSEKAEERKCMVAVKVRGIISAQREARDTLDMLQISHTHHAVIVNDSPSYLGMLKRVQSYVTWGEVSKETLALMLQKRGRLAGNKRLTDADAEKLGYKTLGELADAIASCKVNYQKLPGITPIFKLHPPKKGFKGKTKKSYRAGGEAGYRGEAINELLKRMI